MDIRRREGDRWQMVDACYWLPWYTGGPAGWDERDRAAADQVIAAAEAARDHDPDRVVELLEEGGDPKHCARVSLYWLALQLISSPDPRGLVDSLIIENTTPTTLVVWSETLELASALAVHLAYEADVPPEDTELHRLLTTSQASTPIAAVTAVGLLALIWGHYPDGLYPLMKQTYGSACRHE